MNCRCRIAGIVCRIPHARARAFAFQIRRSIDGSTHEFMQSAKKSHRRKQFVARDMLKGTHELPTGYRPAYVVETPHLIKPCSDVFYLTMSDVLGSSAGGVDQQGSPKRSVASRKMSQGLCVTYRWCPCSRLTYSLDLQALRWNEFTLFLPQQPQSGCPTAG